MGDVHEIENLGGFNAFFIEPSRSKPLGIIWFKAPEVVKRPGFSRAGWAVPGQSGVWGWIWPWQQGTPCAWVQIWSGKGLERKGGRAAYRGIVLECFPPLS